MKVASLLCLLLTGWARKEPRMVVGSHHTLPEYAAENQQLLHLPSTPISDTQASVNQAFQQNAVVEKYLKMLVQLPYFSTYKVDLSDSRCPLEDDTATCAHRQCAIEPLSSKDIEEKLFQQQYLSRLRKDSVSKEAPPSAGVDGCLHDEESLYAPSSSKDYCYPEDESLESEGVWVDLEGNSERFTGYSGDHARLMWSKMYGENCFGYSGEHPQQSLKMDRLLPGGYGGLDGTLAPRADQDPVIPTSECVEQRLFYRLLSGLHSSVSTHLCYEWLDVATDKWQKNLPEWLERVGWREDRLNNLFFDYVLMTRAVTKLITVYESQLLFSASCETVDSEVRLALRRLGRLLRSSPLADAIDEQNLFSSPDGLALKNEFRRRVRNVNALMSCVGCERCRLWGKIQTAGYGTALKILFELPKSINEDNKEAVAEVLHSFRRSELVALINTFARISHSVEAVQDFHRMVTNQLIDRDSFSYQWSIAWNETVSALKFILKSYIDLPRNILFLLSFYFHQYWHKLVMGVSPYQTQVDIDSGLKVEL